jgi:hypothetical protein
VRTLGLGQRFEPVGDLVEAFVTRGLGHARVHVGVLVRFAGDRGFRFSLVLPIGLPVAGSPTLLEVLEVAVRVAGLAFGGRAEHGRDIVVALDVRLGREVQVTTVGLRLAGKASFRFCSVWLPFSSIE